MPTSAEVAARFGSSLALAGVLVFVLSASAEAGDDVLSAGFTPAVALGILDGSTLASGPAPPPSPPVSYYARVSTRGPYGQRCWYEARQIWGGYGFFVGRVRVCD